MTQVVSTAPQSDMEVWRNDLAEALHTVVYFANPVFGKAEDEGLTFANAMIAELSQFSQAEAIERIWQVQALLGGVASSLMEKLRNSLSLDDDDVRTMVGRHMVAHPVALTIGLAISYTLCHTSEELKLFAAGQRMAEMSYVLGLLANEISPFQSDQ